MPARMAQRAAMIGCTCPTPAARRTCSSNPSSISERARVRVLVFGW
ncbi:MAG: hypothetical protein QM765_00320 [Myxococcales bacterium]